MSPWLRTPMMVTSLLIAVPTGIKIFNWLATMWEGKLHFRMPMLPHLALRWACMPRSGSVPWPNYLAVRLRRRRWQRIVGPRCAGTGT
jgi:hypothetical protein